MRAARPTSRLAHRLRAAGATALIATAACSSCKKAPPSQAPVPDGGAAGVLTPEQAAQVLARVGDRTITLGDYVAALQHLDSFDRLRYQSAERRKELLGEMIDVMLLADEARAKGYDKDPVTEQEIREILRDAMLRQARAGLPGPSEIPADDVRAYFDAHKADFRDPERRRVSAIVLATPAAAEGALDAAKKASPAQWGELVRARSIDAQAKGNVPPDLAGDFGFVAPPGDPKGENARVPEEARAAVFQVGAVGDVVPHVVKAGGRYYVVKLAAKTEPHERTLQEAERMIRVKLAQEAIHASEEKMLAELKQQFPVKIDEDALSQVKVELPGADAGR
jgi:hypothetical protein